MISSTMPIETVPAATAMQLSTAALSTQCDACTSIGPLRQAFAIQNDEDIKQKIVYDAARFGHLPRCNIWIDAVAGYNRYLCAFVHMRAWSDLYAVRTLG